MKKAKLVFAGIAALGASCGALAATGCPEFWVQRPRGGMHPIVRAADFGFSVTNEFNGAAINRAIEHCRKIKAKTLELDPGEYSCFDVQRGVVVSNLTDFTLDGRGAVLVFRRPAQFRCQPQSELIHDSASLLIKDCERVKVCDLKIDWDWKRDPLACFCVCTAIHVDEKNPNSSYADFVFTDFERHPRYPNPVPVQKMQVMDTNRTSFARSPRWHFGLSEGHWGSKSEWLAPNRLRLWPGVKAEGKPYNPTCDFLLTPSHNIAYTKNFKVGEFYRLQHYYYGKNGINMVSNRHLTIQDVDIWSCFGMGMVVDGKQKYWKVENVNISPRPDAPYKRPMSSSSDGYHVARSCGYGKHINLQVRLNNDDALNFHDRFGLGAKRGRRTIEIIADRGIGYFRPEPGDPFELRTTDWRPTGFTARFVRAEGNMMFLDRDIPDSIDGNLYVFDRAYGTDNILLRNCIFEDTANRNLFSSSNMTIEDCVFRRVGSRTIWILADARKKTWCEGLGETNIVVRNNRFESCCYMAPSYPMFSTALVTQLPWETGAQYQDFISDIVFEDNIIVDPPGPLVRFEAGRKIAFRNNDIRYTRPPSRDDAGKIENFIGKEAVIEGNTFITNLPHRKIVYERFPEAERNLLGVYPVIGAKKYVIEGGYIAESFTPGALISLYATELDANGNELARHDARSSQIVCATGFPHELKLPFTAHKSAVSVRVEIVSAGNPVVFTPMQTYLTAEKKSPLYGGIYDKEDPPPVDKARTLSEMAKLPRFEAVIAPRKGRNVLMVDGKPFPLNQYKGFTDYRLMGECGGNTVITFNRGTRLFLDATFDEAVRDEKTGEFDFSRVEETLLRIHEANPAARVIVNVDLDPDKDFLERNPDAIFVNEKGVRGRSAFGAFRGYDSTPLDPKNKRMNWAYSYTSAKWQNYVKDGLRRLCEYLKSTPAGNIVIGFHLAGGMDGQFVQWEYGSQNGHFDYSEENRKALCEYLKEIYATDAALQRAWGDPSVTLETARNPSVAEFKSRQAFDDRPGFGRRLADCRRFVSVGPARALNGFARTLKGSFGRKCVVETWYTSTLWSQAGRLALDELVKDGGVDIICTVSGYSYLRALDGFGCSADNSIAALNLRNLIYVQEMDHRTWRTQHTGGWMSESTAIPVDADAFANQIRRDAGSVIAAGGAGFHFFDMFGSWYHGSKVKPVIKEVFALNRFATENAGKYPLPRVAIFTDEKARLLRENTYDCVNVLWRTSGVMPAIHYLADVENPALPDYDLMVVWSPVTITAAQADILRRKAMLKGKVLAMIGEAGCGSRDFFNTADVLAKFGVKARHSSSSCADTVVRVPVGTDPVLEGWDGVSDAFGMSIKNGRLARRYQIGFTTVEDPAAKTLGVWERRGGAAFVRKPLGEGEFIYMAREGGLSPSLLNAIARAAGIVPFAEPGNATYVGNGVAAVHRLKGPAKVDFGRTVTLIDPASGNVQGQTRFWTPDIKVGESAAIAYR